MKLTSTLKRAAAIVAILLAGGAANAAVIGFDELTNSGSGHETYASVTSGGFVFANSMGSSGAFVVWGASHPYNADPGGATLTHNYANTTTVMTKAGGGTFSLLSVDFGDVYNQPGNGLTIQIVGTRSDLSTVIETITTDLLAGLETFMFDTLTDLVSVAWTPIAGTSNRFLQFDNVAVGGTSVPVPEPMTLSLLGGGLVALTALRRRRHRT